jgi:GrpB-like predicted nucleotidyltransferase (UPF0157 family)
MGCRARSWPASRWGKLSAVNQPGPEGFDEYLDAVLVGGREERVIEIVEYRPEWAERFKTERDRIGSELGPRARTIEHIGSTAVPGLAAKPIVDIMVTVEDPDDESCYLPQLENVGYVVRVREGGHRMLRNRDRHVHVHIWAAGSEDERRHRLFREWLRSSAEDRAAYERMKRDLAGRYNDMNYYAQAKSNLVERIIERASRQKAPSDEKQRP